MALGLAVSEAAIESPSFAQGPIKFQLLSYKASGATTSLAASFTASRLSQVYHVIMDGYVIHTAAPTFSGNSVTVALTLASAAAAAALVLGGVTSTAVTKGASGNAISVAYTAGGTAGAEVVTVVGNAISVQIEDGVSSITQVRTAINAAPAAAALVTATGTSATVVAAASAQFLASGADNGNYGTILCIGRQ